MVDYSAPLYKNTPEVWDANRCDRESKRTRKDGLGTPYPFKGYIGNQQYGEHRYNGGCIRDNEWWQGENFPLPIVSDGYKIIRVPSWGYRIVREVTDHVGEFRAK